MKAPGWPASHVAAIAAVPPNSGGSSAAFIVRRASASALGGNSERHPFWAIVTASASSAMLIRLKAMVMVPLSLFSALLSRSATSTAPSITDRRLQSRAWRTITQVAKAVAGQITAAEFALGISRIAP